MVKQGRDHRTISDNFFLTLNNTIVKFLSNTYYRHLFTIRKFVNRRLPFAHHLYFYTHLKLTRDLIRG